MSAGWRRVRQFGQALTARVRPEEYALVAAILPAEAAQLFSLMGRQDQRHGLDVLHGLRERGEQAAELLAAALLHDVGKAEGVRTGHRVVTVLLSAIWPAGLKRLALNDTLSWRYPFWLQLYHPQRGGELAEAAGCTAATVQLIRYHQRKDGIDLPMDIDRWLAQLQAVDEEC